LLYISIKDLPHDLLAFNLLEFQLRLKLNIYVAHFYDSCRKAYSSTGLDSCNTDIKAGIAPPMVAEIEDWGQEGRRRQDGAQWLDLARISENRENLGRAIR